MGKAGRGGLNKAGDLPGPGSYSQIPGAFDPKKGISMTGRNDPRRHSYDSPGPGSYSYDNNPTKDRAPAYGMGGRHSTLRQSDIPGPGQYDGDFTKVRERAGRAGFGTGKRGYGKLNDAPGPG